MNIKNLIITLVIVFAVQEMYPQFGWKKAYNYNELNINRISIPVNNYGGLDYRNSWGFWEFESNKRTIVFDQGLWVIGKIDDQVHFAHNQWGGSYSPGPIIEYDAAINVHPEDSTKYRVYKIGANDSLNPGIDYFEWPGEFGAPVDEEGYPVIYNNQTLWTVYNGMDSSLSVRKWWNNARDTLPVFPVEVQNTVYATEGGNINWIKDIVFFEWLIINKGFETIDSAYFGLWTDIDINEWLQNFSAVDTSIQLGYCWTPSDSGYFIPMSVGYVWKYGPALFSPGDSSIFNGSKKIDYKNLVLTSFHGIIDDAAVDPLIRPARSTLDAWNMARGFDADGNVIIDPTNGLPTKFPFNGDPVTNSGFICPDAGGGGAGFVMFSGPVSLAPQDTQWVMSALIVGTGNDYRDAIENLRLKAAAVQSLSYDELVTKNSMKPSLTLLPQEFYLSQNYPNPFNSGTTIKFELPNQSNVTITIYDILGNRVSTIVNGEFEAGEHSVSFLSTALASGIYFYQLKAGEFIQTKKMLMIK